MLERTQISDPRGEGNTKNPVSFHGKKGQCEMVIFLFCCHRVNFAKHGTCLVKGIQCPSRCHFSELTPQDRVLAGTVRPYMHISPAQIKNSSI